MRIEEKIAFLLEKICQAYKNNAWQIAYKEGLTPTQIDIIQIVSSYPEVSNSHIARELGITKPTVSEAVKTLINKNLLSSREDPTDKRKKILKLTTKGKRLIKKLEALNQFAINSIGKLNAKQKKCTYNVLLTLTKEMKENGLLEVVRICPFCANRTGSKRPICKITRQPATPERFLPNCPHFKMLE